MRKLRPGPLANQNNIEHLAGSANTAIAEYPADSVPALERFPNLNKMSDASLYTHLERRAGARINLEQLGTKSSTRFRVSVGSAQKKTDVKPIDMSLKDICVESAQEIASHGDRVDITLSYDDITVVLPAIAVRQNSVYRYTAFVFTDDDGNRLSHSNFYLDLIFHTLSAEVDKLRYGRLAYFMLSAVCSMLLVSWVLV